MNLFKYFLTEIVLMSQCCYIYANDENNNDLDNLSPCKYKSNYGSYCYKHRRFHLIDENNLIISRHFTGLSKDYLKKDLIYYYKHILKGNKDHKNKEDLFNGIKQFINSIRDYSNNVSKIIKIQGLFRGNLQRKSNIMIQCNNDEDFYTYELLKDIPRCYLYSYCDNKNFRWGFDIRSFEKLIELNYPNPYTTEIIPSSIIEDVKKNIKILKEKVYYEDLIDSIQRDRKELIKQNIVDLFSNIEQLGYSCQIEWFLNLNIRKLKELYKQLEDIWNYRAQLSNEVKRRLCPPQGKMFITPILDIMNMNNIEDIQEIITQNISIFRRCNADSDKRLGYMYFIIGLSNVSSHCYATHCDWLAFIN